MDRQLVAAMERMLVATFPPLATAARDGVLVGSSHGVTGRANSATVTGEVRDDGTLRWACDWLAARGHPPLFRLSPLAAPEIADLLGLDNAHGTTSCMHRSLPVEVAGGQADPAVALSAHRPPGWISEGDAQRDAEVAAVMGNVDGTTAWALICEGTRALAAGRGVVVDDWLCIQAMYTEPAARGQGFATRIMETLHRWAIDVGATHAFLNVLATNRAAQSIYERHGYFHIYDYSYVAWPGGPTRRPTSGASRPRPARPA